MVAGSRSSQSSAARRLSWSSSIRSSHVPAVAGPGRVAGRGAHEREERRPRGAPGGRPRVAARPRGGRRRTRGSCRASRTACPRAGPSPIRRRLCSASRSMPSSTSMGRSSVGSTHSVSAMASSPPPANTPSRANSAPLLVVEEVVAPVDRAPQRPLALRQVPAAARLSSPSRSPSRARDRARGESSRIRAAASSIASGSPSSRRTISATSDGVLGGEREVRAGRPCARSTNSRTASVLADRRSTSVAPTGGHGRAAGPGTPARPTIRSGARLETMTLSLWAPPRGGPATSRRPRHDLLEVVEDEQRPCAPRRCSMTRSRRHPAVALSTPRVGRRSSAATRSGSEIAASGTNHDAVREAVRHLGRDGERRAGSCRCRRAR